AAAAKLVVGRAKGGLGLDSLPASDVDEHEQQVAVFLGPVGGGGGLAQLGQLLDDLVEDALDVRPLVADVRGSLLHLLACGEGRQDPADAIEGAFWGGGCSGVGRAIGVGARGGTVG